MQRVPRYIAMDLIQYARKVNVVAHVWDNKAVSAFEFARQMSSPKLKKQNPQFECEFVYNEKDEPATLSAEFSDGSTWNTLTGDYTCADLRGEFYHRASLAEERLEDLEEEKEKSKGGKR